MSKRRKSVTLWVAVLLPLTRAMAADLVKADNSQALNAAASWTNNVAPASTHRLIWSSVVAAPANCTNAVTASINALGVRIADPPADVSITSSGSAGITLNASGVDLSTASRDLAVNVPTTASFVQNKDASWVVAAGRTLTLNSKVYVQNSTGTNLVTWTGGGTIRLAGGSAFPFNVVNSANATGMLLVSNITLHAGNPLTLCAGTNSVGLVSQTGGSVYLQGVDLPGYSLALGDRNDSAGTYDLSGGSLTVATNVFVGPERQVTNVVAQFIIRGAGTASVMSDIWMGGYKSTNAQSTLTLKTGGALIVRAIRVDGSVAGGTSKLELDGGVLSPLLDTASFISGLTQATLSANGAFIDTAGRSVAVRQRLEDAAGQVGWLVKLGAGTLTLTNAAHSFTGPIAVSNGTLRVASNATVASTNWTVSAGATLELGASASLAGKSLMIDAGGAMSPGLLSVKGDLVLGGRLTVLNAGDRQKIAQCTGALTGAFSEAELPSGCVLRVVDGRELWAVKVKGTVLDVL